MDELDAFDTLYRNNEKAIALLTTVLDYAETEGTDLIVMLIMEIALEFLKSPAEAWDVLEKKITCAGTGEGEALQSAGG